MFGTQQIILLKFQRDITHMIRKLLMKISYCLIVLIISINQIHAQSINLVYFENKSPISIYYNKTLNLYYYPKTCLEEKTCMALDKMNNIKKLVKTDYPPLGINPGEHLCPKLQDAKRVQLLSANGAILIMCRFNDSSMISAGALARKYFSP